MATEPDGADDVAREFSPSEKQFLRDNIRERDHRRWLISWIKTLATWIGAGLSVMWAGIDGVTKLINWLTPK